MTRLTLFFILSLAACGGAPQSEAPTGAEKPAAQVEHDDAKAHDDDAKPHDGDMEGGQPMYVCPMHPDITAHEPGDCSKCGMDLVEQKSHDHASHDHGEQHDANDDHGH